MKLYSLIVRKPLEFNKHGFLLIKQKQLKMFNKETNINTHWEKRKSNWNLISNFSTENHKKKQIENIVFWASMRTKPVLLSVLKLDE